MIKRPVVAKAGVGWAGQGREGWLGGQGWGVVPVGWGRRGVSRQSAEDF